MVNSRELDGVYRCLAHETRRDILLRLSLAISPLTVSQIETPYVPGEMSSPAVSKHLRVLEEAGLITRRKRGRTCDVSLKVELLNEARDFIDRLLKLHEAKLNPA